MRAYHHPTEKKACKSHCGGRKTVRSQYPETRQDGILRTSMSIAEAIRLKNSGGFHSYVKTPEQEDCYLRV
jgi:hypothetical protein